MTMEKHLALVSELHEGTQEGILEWSSTLRPDAFEVPFANYTVRISADEQDYRISVVDAIGRIIESFTHAEIATGPEAERQKYYKMLEEIYEMARRKAYGVDEALNDILEEIRKTKTPI